jgi:predicted MFS family arabinose efflux permease
VAVGTGAAMGQASGRVNGAAGGSDHAGPGRRVFEWIRSGHARPGRVRTVVLLAAVLALNTADSGVIGAAATQLEADLRISHAQLGLLATASSGVGAIAAIPMGALADRVTRVRLLAATVTLWAAAMIAGGVAANYWWLLLSRLLLGVAVAAAGPVVVSLTGDFIPPADRAGVLGWILSGEIIGAGAGLLAGGVLAATLSWRYAFFLLAAVSLVLVLALLRLLPEPARGGGGQLGRSDSLGQAKATVIDQGIAAEPDRVLGGDPERLPITRALAYLLRIPTNRLLIIASALGYFFFAGLRTFAVIFAVRHFGVSQGALGALLPFLGIGAVLGTVLGGRLTDAALRRGRTKVRITVPAVGFVAAAVFFVPGVTLTSIVVALPLIVLGTAALSAANPPLDAARLDIVPARLWGRAEGLRTVTRLAAEALAPAAFGLLADVLDGLAGRGGGTGLRNAFLIMLVPLLANGLIMLAARRTYPVDVATAAASDQRQQRDRRAQPG